MNITISLGKGLLKNLIAFCLIGIIPAAIVTYSRYLNPFESTSESSLSQSSSRAITTPHEEAKTRCFLITRVEILLPEQV
jgi:hypothetical protein